MRLKLHAGYGAGLSGGRTGHLLEVLALRSPRTAPTQSAGGNEPAVTGKYCSVFAYLTIFAALVMLGLRLGDGASRQLLPWAGLFLLWFMGTRYYVGCDFGSYMLRFDNFSSGEDFWTEIVRAEAGFQLLVASVKSADLEYMWLNIVASAIFLACALTFCKSHRRPLMVLALLFPVMIIQLGMSGLRQALATAFLMLATVAFVQGKRVLTGLLVLVGGLFHLSVVIFLPMALVAGRTVSLRKLIVAIVLLAPAAYLILQYRVDVYLDRYVEQIYGEMVSGGALIRYVLLLVSAVAFVRYRESLKDRFPESYNLLLLFTIITFAMLPVSMISTVVLHRIIYYVMPVSILTLVYVSLVMAPRRSVSLGRLAPALLYGAYSASWFFTSKHAGVCYTPYQSYSFL